MIDSITLRGGKPLSGEVVVRGAKNCIPKCMVAALLTQEKCVLNNVANIEDVKIVAEMIEALGGRVNVSDGRVELECVNISFVDSKKLDAFTGRSRIPVLFCGPVLSRLGLFEIPILGGCKIGPRPINFHLDALRAMGANVTKEPERIKLTALKLRGAKINLPYPSVGATEQVLLSAVLSDGVTELSGAAIEPEVIELVALLQKMGANIFVGADRKITITGVLKLHGYSHEVMPDRIEVASWAAAAAATGGDIFVKNARQMDMVTFLNKYREIGGEFEVKNDGIRFFRGGERLLPTIIQTEVHPGFMTDWQQPFVVALTQAEGTSIVHETVYEDRFGYVAALNAMGAKIELNRECLGNIHCRFGQKDYLHSAVITGPARMTGANIKVPDLRGGFSYIIAALVAEGISKINNLNIIYRGYEKFADKLEDLSADVLEHRTFSAS